MKAFHASPPLTEDAAINAIAAKHATTPQVRACRKEPQASTQPDPHPPPAVPAPLSTPTPAHSTYTPPTLHRQPPHTAPKPT